MTYNKAPPPPWPSWRDQKIDHLYIIESSCGWFKIGRTDNVSARLRGIECTCPPTVSITCIAVVMNYGMHEYTLHEALATYRGRGEWFGPDAGQVIRAALAEGIEGFICRLAAEQTAPRYVARNKRFAAVQEKIRRDADQREQRERRDAEQHEQRERRRQEETSARNRKIEARSLAIAAKQEAERSAIRIIRDFRRKKRNARTIRNHFVICGWHYTNRSRVAARFIHVAGMNWTDAAEMLGVRPGAVVSAYKRIYGQDAQRRPIHIARIVCHGDPTP